MRRGRLNQVLASLLRQKRQRQHLQVQAQRTRTRKKCGKRKHHDRARMLRLCLAQMSILLPNKPGHVPPLDGLQGFHRSSYQQRMRKIYARTVQLMRMHIFTSNLSFRRLVQYRVAVTHICFQQRSEYTDYLGKRTRLELALARDFFSQRSSPRYSGMWKNCTCS